jgi:hypothetical protein
MYKEVSEQDLKRLFGFKGLPLWWIFCSLVLLFPFRFFILFPLATLQLVFLALFKFCGAIADFSDEAEIVCRRASRRIAASFPPPWAIRFKEVAEMTNRRQQDSIVDRLEGNDD